MRVVGVAVHWIRIPTTIVRDQMQLAEVAALVTGRCVLSVYLL